MSRIGKISRKLINHFYSKAAEKTRPGNGCIRLASLILMGVVGLAGYGILLPGCSTTHAEATARSPYAGYRRVAIISNLTRRQEEYFIPHYMQSFPTQALVERRDLNTLIDEHDSSLDDLTREKRTALAEFGVEGIIYPHFSDNPEAPQQFSIKIIDTKTGEIVAAVLITPKKIWLLDDATKRDMMKTAIHALEKQKDHIISNSVRSSVLNSPSGADSGL